MFRSITDRSNDTMWTIDNGPQHTPHWPDAGDNRECYIACPLYPATRRSLQVVTRAGHVDYPVQYPDGSIAYDFPERVPIFLQLWTEKAFNA